MDKFVHRTAERIKRILKTENDLQESLLVKLAQGEPTQLTSSVAEAILRQACNTPPQRPDIIIFSSGDWETLNQKSQLLVIQLAEFGHRIFYVQTSQCQGSAPQIKKTRQNTYLIMLPEINNTSVINSPLSLDEVVKLRESLLQIIKAFNIRTAFLKVDQPYWIDLATYICQERSWRLVYDCTQKQPVTPGYAEKFRQAELFLLDKSDLVIFSSPTEQVDIGRPVRNAITIPDIPDVNVDNREEVETSRIKAIHECAEMIEGELYKRYPKISIIVVTYNKLEYTRMCLESLVRNTDYPNYEIILVDNGSKDGSVEVLREFREQHQQVMLIENARNLGFAMANNMGAKAASGEYLVLLNNDTLVTPGWLLGLLVHLTRHPSAGMVGPVTNAIGNEAKIRSDYKELSEINYFAARRADRYAGIAFEIRVLALYCAMISRSLYSRLGGLDERFAVGMFEDDDLALKIKQVGLVLICAEDVFIHHFHGMSFNQFEDQELQRIFHENRIKFEQKWGVTWQPHQNRPRT